MSSGDTSGSPDPSGAAPAGLGRWIRELRKPAPAGFLGLWLASLALYVTTLCPDLYWYDAAEFVNDAALLDIPHPPGYPLFNLLNFLFLRIPVGPLAVRANFFSAFSASLAVGLVYLALRTMGAGTALALGGAALLAVAPEFWELSTVAEVYTFEALLLAGALVGLARMYDAPPLPASGKPAAEDPVCRPAGWPLALMLGALVLHRPTTVFFVLPWLAMLRSNVHSWPAFLGTMAIPACAYMHTAWVFFLKPDLPGRPWSINYFDFPRTVETFVRVSTGTLYAGNLRLLYPQEVVHELMAYLWLLREQLGAVLAAISLVALVQAFRGRLGPVARYVAVLAGANVVFFVFYNALEKDTMYLPSIMALLILGVLQVARIGEHLGRPRVLAAALAVWAVVHGWMVHPEVDRSRYREVRRTVDTVAAFLPRQAVLYLTDDLIIHPFLHLSMVEGRRRDVTITIVDGFGEQVEKGLRDRLAKGYSVFSPLFYPEETFAQIARTYRLVPRGFLYEITTGSARALPVSTGRDDRWGELVLQGCAIGLREATVRPSDTIQAILTWKTPVAGDPAVVFRWAGQRAGGPRPTLSWAFPIGYQRRPERQGRLAEEYLLKVPWDLDRGVGGHVPLEVTVIDSIAAAVARGELRRRRTQDWGSTRFFKGMTESFVRCIERGAPAFSEVLEYAPAPGSPDRRWVGLVPVTIASEE